MQNGSENLEATASEETPLIAKIARKSLKEKKDEKMGDAEDKTGDAEDDL